MKHWRVLIGLVFMVLLSSCTIAKETPPKITPRKIGCNVSEQISAKVAMLVAKLQYEKALKDPTEFSFMHLPADEVLAKLRQDYDDKLKAFEFWENHVRQFGHIHNFTVDTATKHGQPDTSPTKPGVLPFNTTPQ
ncbi:MAG: hypothetical protein NTY53_13165 [Kiritimatiellaeota bacterium]|nr:hypothetical protein [Kiritimatiellota bacterium]